MSSMLCVLVILVCCHVGVTADADVDYAYCVVHQTPSDHAAEQCEALIRGTSKASPTSIKDLALHICLRTVACDLRINLNSIERCHVTPAIDHAADFACREAFIEDAVGVHGNDRSNRLTNCEQTVEETCSKYSHLTNSIKLDHITKDVSKLSSQLKNLNETVVSVNGSLISVNKTLSEGLSKTIKMPEDPQWLIYYGVYSVGCTLATTGSLNPTWFILYVCAVLTETSWLLLGLLWLLPVVGLYVKIWCFNKMPVWADTLIKTLHMRSTTNGDVLSELEEKVLDDDGLRRFSQVVDVAAEYSANSEDGNTFMAFQRNNIEQVSSEQQVDLPTRSNGVGSMRDKLRRRAKPG